MMLMNIQKADHSILKQRKILDSITQKKQKFQKQSLEKFDRSTRQRNQMMTGIDMCFHPSSHFPSMKEVVREAEVLKIGEGEDFLGNRLSRTEVILQIVDTNGYHQI